MAIPRETIIEIINKTAKELSKFFPDDWGISIVVSDGKAATYVGSNTKPEELRKWVNAWADRAARGQAETKIQ